MVRTPEDPASNPDLCILDTGALERGAALSRAAEDGVPGDVGRGAAEGEREGPEGGELGRGRARRRGHEGVAAVEPAGDDASVAAERGPEDERRVHEETGGAASRRDLVGDRRVVEEVEYGQGPRAPEVVRDNVVLAPERLRRPPDSESEPMTETNFLRYL